MIIDLKKTILEIVKANETKITSFDLEKILQIEREIEKESRRKDDDGKEPLTIDSVMDRLRRMDSLKKFSTQDWNAVKASIEKTLR